MGVARWLHILGVVVWVGGMFFAYMALRPAAAALAPPVRLPLMAAAMTRFAAWVALAIVAIVASGLAMVAMQGGFGAVGAYVHVMAGIALAMIGLYVYLVAVPLREVRAGVAASDWPRAGSAMQRVRHLVAVNLVLGIVVISIAVMWR